MKYTIEGDNLPVVICQCDAGEALVTERGGMSWMSDTFDMSTNMPGGLMKGIGRMLSGESLFLTTYTARSAGMIAFGSCFPGAIRAVQLAPGESIICQKEAFMASESSVSLAVHFQRKLGSGFFSGEGFVMQKITGPGLVFLEIDGSACEYNLAAGEKMIVDTGSLAMCDATVDIDVQMVKGFKNVLFSGEGLFLTTVTGPGRIVLQSMPFADLANRIIAKVPNKS